MQLFMSFIFAAMITMVVYFISLPFADNRKKNEKLLEQAIRDGHVVNAVQYKARSYKAPTARSKFGCTRGYYKYTYHGKTYKYQYEVGIDENPPSILKLYFVKNPRKATVALALSDTKINFPLLYVILVVVIYFVGFRG